MALNVVGGAEEWVRRGEKGQSAQGKFEWPSRSLQGTHAPYVPNAHADQTTVPSLNNLASAELELEGVSAVEGRIELGAVLQGTLWGS